MAMRTSIALTPKKATFAPLLYAGDMDRGIRRAAELGYDGVELNLQDPRLIDADRLIDTIHSLGLVVVAQGTGQAYIEEGLYIASTDPAKHAAVIERLKAHIDFATIAGSQVVLGGIRGVFSKGPETRRREYKAAIEVVRQLDVYAADRGVQLTIEPINRYETNFINTMQDALDFLADAGTDRVKVLIDTFHANIEERTFEEAFRLAGNRLSHVHLVDSNRQAPGHGHIDFLSILLLLREIGYDGYLSAEILPIPDSEVAAQAFISNVKTLLAEL